MTYTGAVIKQSSYSPSPKYSPRIRNPLHRWHGESEKVVSVGSCLSRSRQTTASAFATSGWVHFTLWSCGLPPMTARISGFVFGRAWARVRMEETRRGKRASDSAGIGELLGLLRYGSEAGNGVFVAQKSRGSSG